MAIDPDTERGLYNKYKVTKTNGKEVGQCFVLEEHDPFAPIALRMYANACDQEFPLLAADLRELAERWYAAQHEETTP